MNTPHFTDCSGVENENVECEQNSAAEDPLSSTANSVKKEISDDDSELSNLEQPEFCNVKVEIFEDGSNQESEPVVAPESNTCFLKEEHTLDSENEHEQGENRREVTWTDDIKIFQPYEKKQILLPDKVSCLSVQAFLKMCSLKYEVIERVNAEEMSPSRFVPFVKCDAFLISELEPLIKFVENVGISLTKDLDKVQICVMRAYMSLINTVLFNAEKYITWVDKVTYNKITKKRYGCLHPWPLSEILTRTKKQQVYKGLNVLGWLNKTIEQVYEEVDTCCSALSENIDEKKYFFGDKPTELDALMFAHTYTILTTPLPSNEFATIIRRYPKVVKHCQRVEQEYFRN